MGKSMGSTWENMGHDGNLWNTWETSWKLN